MGLKNLDLGSISDHTLEILPTNGVWKHLFSLIPFLH